MTGRFETLILKRKLFEFRTTGFSQKKYQSQLMKQGSRNPYFLNLHIFLIQIWHRDKFPNCK